MMMLTVVLALSLQAQTPAAGTLDAFIAQVDREWPGESRQQAITTDSLRLMADAVAAVAARGRIDSPRLARPLQQFREETERYAKGKPGTERQSEQLRRTFLTGVAVMEALTERVDEGRTLKARVSALERAAKSLDDDDPVLRQPDVIERFFRHAGEILKLVEAGAPRGQMR
jgi:hypothetical protein